MAYQIQGVEFLSNSRELLGINTAGINTALYVGDNFSVDAATGIITAQSFVGDGSLLTGVVNESGGDVAITGNLDVDTLDVTGRTNLADLNVSGATTMTEGAAGIATFSASGIQFSQPLQLTSGAAIQSFSADGTMAGASDSAVPTQLAVTQYVAAQVGASNNLSYQDGDGNSFSFELAGDTFSYLEAAPNGVTVLAAQDQLTFGLDADVQIVSSVTAPAVNASATFELNGSGQFTRISQDLATDFASTDLASAAAIVTYVDNATSGGGGDLNINDLQAVSGSFNGTSGIATFAEAGIAFNKNVDAPTSAFTVAGLSASATVSALTVETTQLDLASYSITEISNDPLLADSSPAALPTEDAVKQYVDAQLTSQNNLQFEGDGGIVGQIDLGAEILDFQGTPNQIETAVDVAGGNQVTFSLSPNVQGLTSLQAGALSATGQVSGDSLSASNGLIVTSGGFGITGDSNLTGNLTATGNIQANDFNSTSDINKKENIEEIPEALAKVNALRGVTFDWKDGSGTSGGIIAQEVEAVLPSLVKEGEEHKTVIYNGLVGLLINAVKELSAEVAELKAAK